jgi:hypothetical protein
MHVRCEWCGLLFGVEWRSHSARGLVVCGSGRTGSGMEFVGVLRRDVIDCFCTSSCSGGCGYAEQRCGGVGKQRFQLHPRHFGVANRTLSCVLGNRIHIELPCNKHPHN